MWGRGERKREKRGDLPVSCLAPFFTGFFLVFPLYSHYTVHPRTVPPASSLSVTTSSSPRAFRAPPRRDGSLISACTPAPAQEALDPHIHGAFLSPSNASQCRVSLLTFPSPVQAPRGPSSGVRNPKTLPPLHLFLPPPVFLPTPPLTVSPRVLFFSLSPRQHPTSR